jgi:UDPglucose 6-dehydrogenase
VLIEALLRAGAEVRAYDPVAGGEAAKILAGNRRVAFADSATSALEGCDALCVVTEWQEFRSPDFDALKSKLRTPAVFDGRNLYDPVTMKRLGIEYFPIGRTPVGAA